MKPTIGRIVHYTLSQQDADAINKRRADAHNLNAAGVTLASQALGPQIHVGNHAFEGDVYPAMVVRIFHPETTTANLQVFLDGNDTYWATSRTLGDGPSHWAWPERV
ncbi:hypothetical protein [Streptomyces cylindrosporus]|uniref:Uncharacterized protein n=1 Tax=Streptomyces cylindrosporus TaxID=2927583 RepID=A0ABS9Y2F1_9ACTN|nr:hypothetical protein [Streptomyces cylindrosporus]MCI3271386.1 hypothetical protein [Streptomyces cylindrosporus]